MISTRTISQELGNDESKINTPEPPSEEALIQQLCQEHQTTTLAETHLIRIMVESLTRKHKLETARDILLQAQTLEMTLIRGPKELRYTALHSRLNITINELHDFTHLLTPLITSGKALQEGFPTHTSEDQVLTWLSNMLTQLRNIHGRLARMYDTDKCFTITLRDSFQAIFDHTFEHYEWALPPHQKPLIETSNTFPTEILELYVTGITQCIEAYQTHREQIAELIDLESQAAIALASTLINDPYYSGIKNEILQCKRDYFRSLRELKALQRSWSKRPQAEIPPPSEKALALRLKDLDDEADWFLSLSEGKINEYLDQFPDWDEINASNPELAAEILKVNPWYPLRSSMSTLEDNIAPEDGTQRAFPIIEHTNNSGTQNELTNNMTTDTLTGKTDLNRLSGHTNLTHPHHTKRRKKRSR